jgi:hypothetical protein
MSYIQPKSGKIRYLKAEEEWGVKKYLLKKSKHKKIE